MKWKACLLIAFLTLSVSCDKNKEKDKQESPDEKTAKTDEKKEDKAEKEADKDGFQVTSEAFDEGGAIPAKYTCDGDNVSPKISWSNAPEDAKSFVVALVDPDAPEGTFHHWGVYAIPPNQTNIPEGVPAKATLDMGAMQAKNQFGDIGYGGPCPPKGQEHTYIFRVMALDTPGSTFSEPPEVEDMLSDVSGSLLEQAELEATYARK